MSITPLDALSPLRRARLEIGRTLHEVQHATGVNAGKLSRAERRLADLSRAEQRAVCNELGIDPASLFGADTSPPSS